MSASDTLAEARMDFVRYGDHASMGALLTAAYEAWNNEDISEREYVDEVRGIERCLNRLGREEKAASDTNVTSPLSRYLTQGK